MNWIINARSYAFDLSNDERLLKLVGKLDGQRLKKLIDKLKSTLERSDSVYRDIQKVDSPFELLQLFTKDGDFPTNVEEISNALASLGVKSDGLQNIVNDVRPWIDEIPEQYKKLLRPVGDFVEDDVDTDPGLVKWQLLDATKTVNESASKGVALKLDLSGSAALQLEAGHKSSFSNDKRYLRIGIIGDTDAKASAVVPINISSISSGAGGGGILSVNYLMANTSESTLYATAIGSSISAISNPMDFDSIWSNMMESELRVLQVKAEGAAYGTTSVGLARKTAIPGAAKFSAGLTFDAEIRYGGAYRYDVRKIGNSLVELTMACSRETARSKGVGLAVIVDAIKFAEKIKDEVGPKLGKIANAYGDFDKFLMPGSVVRERIDQELKELTNDQLTTKLLQLGLGLTNEAEVRTKLGDIIEGAISTRSAVWQNRAEDGATSILEDLIDRYPVLADGKIKDTLNEKLYRLINAVAKELQEDVKTVTANGTDQLLEALKTSGVKVNNALNTADEALAGVRKALREYHSKIEKILKGIEKYATSEIRIEFQAQSTSTSGTGVSLTANFTGNTGTTQDAYAALLAGDLDTILALRRNQPEGLVIELEEWERFAAFKRNASWNLSVLDISLGAETMFSTKTRISINDDGVIGVLSDGEWTRRRRAYKESKEFGFLDAYSLLAAKQTRSLSANIKLSQEDENTNKDELYDFLRRLEEFGLVQGGTGAAAERLLEQWEGDAGDSEIKTNIAAKLRFSDTEMHSLIRLDARPAELKDESFVNVAYTFLKQVGLVTQEDVNLAVPALRDIPGVVAADLNPTELVAKFTVGMRRDWVMRNQRDSLVRDALREMERLHDKAMALKHLVFALRDIWAADPSQHGVSEDYYRSKQKVIDQSLQKWVKIGSKVIFWLSKETHRSTVAFLLCITFLADIRDRSPMIVTISRNDGEDLILT